MGIWWLSWEFPFPTFLEDLHLNRREAHSPALVASSRGWSLAATAGRSAGAGRDHRGGADGRPLGPRRARLLWALACMASVSAALPRELTAHLIYHLLHHLVFELEKKRVGWWFILPLIIIIIIMLSSIFLKLYLQNCIACNLQHRLFNTVWSYSFSYLVHVWLEPCWYSLFFNFGPLVIFHYHLLTHIKNTSSMASHLSEFSENSLLNNAFNTKNIALSKNVLVVS